MVPFNDFRVSQKPEREIKIKAQDLAFTKNLIKKKKKKTENIDASQETWGGGGGVKITV